MLYFSVLDQKKIKNLMREGEKTFKKKNVELTFGRTNNKTVDKFIENVSISDKIKKPFDPF